MLGEADSKSEMLLEPKEEEPLLLHCFREYWVKRQAEILIQELGQKCLALASLLDSRREYLKPAQQGQHCGPRAKCVQTLGSI